MNYQEMSDYEISCEVGRKISFADYILARNEQVNYCNSWAYAGPIATENNISVIELLTKWMAISSGSGIESYLGEDDEPCLYGEGVDHKDVNPCRAICIVFLMMKGGE